MARPPLIGWQAPLMRWLPTWHDSSSRRARTASSADHVACSVIVRVVVLIDWDAAAELENPTQANVVGPNDTGPNSFGQSGFALNVPDTQNPLTRVIGGIPGPEGQNCEELCAATGAGIRLTARRATATPETASRAVSNSFLCMMLPLPPFLNAPSGDGKPLRRVTPSHKCISSEKNPNQSNNAPLVPPTAGIGAGRNEDFKPAFHSNW
jgi:hypothetical protein